MRNSEELSIRAAPLLEEAKISSNRLGRPAGLLIALEEERPNNAERQELMGKTVPEPVVELQIEEEKQDEHPRQYPIENHAEEPAENQA